MDFYRDLSQFYQYIFPLSGVKVELVKKYLPKGSRILDIGCGTGEMVLKLARDGYQASGMDLSIEMIEKAREDALNEKAQVDFCVGDMREVAELYEGQFDGITCFGNTIVHLTSIEDLKDFFKQIHGMLNPGGNFFFQIVNYDRILDQGIRQLPLIENEEQKLTFYREYEFDQPHHLIHFNTRLVIDGKEVSKHSVPLYPLTSREIELILSEVGFAKPSFFGDFAQGEYHPDLSMALVAMVRHD